MAAKLSCLAAPTQLLQTILAPRKELIVVIQVAAPDYAATKPPVINGFQHIIGKILKLQREGKILKQLREPQRNAAITTLSN